jgi:hypothetical protein
MSADKSAILIQYNKFRVRYQKFYHPEPDFGATEQERMPYDPNPDEQHSTDGESDEYEVNNEVRNQGQIYHLRGSRSKTGYTCRKFRQLREKAIRDNYGPNSGPY